MSWRSVPRPRMAGSGEHASGVELTARRQSPWWWSLDGGPVVGGVPDREHGGVQGQQAGGGNAVMKDQSPRRQRRAAFRWWWLLVSVAILLLGWWGITRFQEGPENAPPRGPATAEPSPRMGNSSGAGGVATRYAESLFRGDVQGACEVDSNPDQCRRVLGSSPPKYELTEPISVIRSEPVPITRGRFNGRPGEGVQIGFTVAGQQHREVAYLVVDGKIVGEHDVTAELTGQPLSTILAGEMR